MEINQIHNEHEHASVSTKVLLLAFAVVLVGVLGYLVYDQRTAPDTTDYSAPSVKKNTEQAAETPTDKTTTTTDETANWKTYSNADLGISFKYPSNWLTPVENKISSKTQIIFFTDNEQTSSYITVDVTSSYSEFYLDTASTGKQMFTSGTANEFIFAKGYCDGPPCSKPFLVEAFDKTKGYYFKLEGDTELSSTEKLILNSVKFI